MAWHIVEKFIEQAGAHSTLIGKFWTTFFFVLRFLVVVSIADTVFGDEQGAFVCNTLTPGCSNVCFNDFSPISMIRLWALQILFVALPTIIFMIYVAHKMAKIDQAKKLKHQEEERIKKQKAKKAKKKAERRKRAEMARRAREGPPEYGWKGEATTDVEKTDAEKEEKKKEDEEVIATKLTQDTPSRLFLAYVIQVIFRMLMEILFMLLQLNIYVYKFYVPELFKCSRWPCPNVVDCFVSRPKEKTIMLWLMFATGLVMILLNVIELYHLGASKIWQAWKDRGQDITKEYKVSSNQPTFGYSGGYSGGGMRYPNGYPQAVGIRVGYARSSLSGEGGNDFDGDEFI